MLRRQSLAARKHHIAGANILDRSANVRVGFGSWQNPHKRAVEDAVLLHHNCIRSRRQRRPCKDAHRLAAHRFSFMEMSCGDAATKWEARFSPEIEIGGMNRIPVHGGAVVARNIDLRDVSREKSSQSVKMGNSAGAVAAAARRRIRRSASSTLMLAAAPQSATACSRITDNRAIHQPALLPPTEDDRRTGSGRPRREVSSCGIPVA